jgi:hypothetical protein
MNEDTGDTLGDLVAQLTDSVGIPDDADESTAVPNALADEVEEYTSHAERRDAHLAVDGEQVDDVQVEPQQPKQQQRVPLAALQQERFKRQQEQEQGRLLQAQLAQIEAQQLAQQQQAQQQAQQAALPDFADDPEGHVKGLVEQFSTVIQQQNEQIQQLSGHHQNQQFHAQTVDAVNYAAQAEAEFRATCPDYDAAFAHVQATAGQQIRQMYPQASEQELQMVEQAALLGFAQHCRANGLNPSEQVFRKAQELGFQPAHRAVRRAAPTSLSSLSGDGRAPDQRGAPGAGDIAAMSDQQFNELFESMRASSGEGQFGF